MLKCFSCWKHTFHSEDPKILSSDSEILPVSTLLVLFAVRADLQPPGQILSIQLMAGLFPRPCPPWSLLGLMRHPSIPKKKCNFQNKKTENTAHEGGTDVAHPSLWNLTESPEGS